MLSSKYLSLFISFHWFHRVRFCDGQHFRLSPVRPSFPHWFVSHCFNGSTGNFYWKYVKLLTPYTLNVDFSKFQILTFNLYTFIFPLLQLENSNNYVQLDKLLRHSQQRPKPAGDGVVGKNFGVDDNPPPLFMS